MNEAQEKYLTALRSGAYEQALGYMVRLDHHGNKTYCCMGVACDVLDEPVYVSTLINGLPAIDQLGPKLENGTVSGQYLPEHVNEALELDPRLNRHMSNWNDADRLSFDEIADNLEAIWNEDDNE